MDIKPIGLLVLLFTNSLCLGQNFFFGADQSYVNEMEDCGERYFEDQQEKDVHQIFADHGCNLVRLRLWHTPSWYDMLNQGKRYSDIEDVKKSIRRVKEAGMQVLLNFHLSDNWADPSKQIIPSAWMEIADETELLADSLYGYVSRTMKELKTENLLPEMVQIGNETNRGILLTPEQNQTWQMEWPRNAQLFNAAIQAVRDFERNENSNVKIALHFAAPSEIEWLAEEFASNGVVDFDIIAMSYYWAWHRPTTIEEAGATIERLRNKYPSKEVLVVETGYPWTLENNDNAPNIINAVQNEYGPASPMSQKQWLIDLTQEVIDKGGIGVIYWEPSWVSTTCWNQWDQGSHQDHATFFDFDNNLLQPGGIDFMNHDYSFATSVNRTGSKEVNYLIQTGPRTFEIEQNQMVENTSFEVIDSTGKSVYQISSITQSQINLSWLPAGNYIAVLQSHFKSKRVIQKIILP